jgi:hypothetical protein
MSTYSWELDENDKVAVTIRRQTGKNGGFEEVLLRFPSLDALREVLPKVAKAIRKDGGRSGEVEL